MQLAGTLGYKYTQTGRYMARRYHPIAKAELPLLPRDGNVRETARAREKRHSGVT
jgi:hypothetical protein